jgi:RimJ/RimL family protein N-acetyltransferase
MYSVRNILPEDIQHIRIWRNEQIKVLRQKHVITEEMQQAYFEKHVFPEYEKEFPDKILVSLLYDGKLIGYGGLVYISWEDQRAEVSFLVETSRTTDDKLYGQDFLNYLRLIKQLAFDQKGFNRLFTETYAFRTFHISILEEAGFRQEGVLKENIYFENEFHDSIMHGFLKKYYELEK